MVISEGKVHDSFLESNQRVISGHASTLISVSYPSATFYSMRGITEGRPHWTWAEY